MGHTPRMRYAVLLFIRIHAYLQDAVKLGVKALSSKRRGLKCMIIRACR